jgi:hypothetical protein
MLTGCSPKKDEFHSRGPKMVEGLRMASIPRLLLKPIGCERSLEAFASLRISWGFVRQRDGFRAESRD